MSGATDSGREVWTVGHSDRSAEGLTALLRARAIERVVDVRAHPWSRRHPWHGRAEMERSLEAAGIAYTWLGAQLGGMRPEGYPAHQRSEEYSTALAELIELARGATVAVLCAERDPSHCHRRFLADDLSREGFTVRHLLDENEVQPHQPSLL